MSMMQVLFQFGGTHNGVVTNAMSQERIRSSPQSHGGRGF
jgi:hypothetical protein